MAEEKKLSKEEIARTVRDETEHQIAMRLDAEYEQGKANNQLDDVDFETHMDMFDGIRTEKNYEWQSDLTINEFLSQQQIQSANEANAQFSRTEFVEVDLQKKDDASLASAEATKETINNTLSRSDLYYFHKYMRSVQTKNIGGRTYIRCFWEQEVRERTQQREEFVTLDVDRFGSPLIDGDQIPDRIRSVVDEVVEDVVKDQFNFEVVDPRNIFYSNEYTYNLRDKNWIALRFDTTPQELEKNKDLMGYFNLDKLNEISLSGDTETKQLTVDRDGRGDVKQEPQRTPVKDIMLVERWGMEYAVVKTRNDKGHPVEIDYGYNESGERKEGAELISLIITNAYIKDEGRMVLVRYQPNPYRDSKGNSYIPIARGLCWIHPTRDRGFGDGHTNRDLQTAINDVYNADMDNTLLGLLKIIKVNKNAMEDQMPLRIEPAGLWELDDPKDAEVVDFDSNTGNATSLISILFDKLQELNASDPGLPIPASATATAVARTEKATTTRSNYRNLVTENTLHFNLYWFIIQMTDQFALEETAIKIMGEENLDAWNPDLDYVYKPVSEAVQTDASRGAKIDRLNTTLGYIVNSPNPQAASVANKILEMIFKLFGDEIQNATKGLFDESQPLQALTGGQGGAEPKTGSPVQAPVNQTGLPQPSQEASAIGSALQ